MSRLLIFPLLLVTVCMLNPSDSYAQHRPTTSKKVSVHAKPIRRQNFNLTVELQRQQKFFGDIATRYEDVSSRNLTPLLNYPHVWNALRENRMLVAGRNLPLPWSQSRLFKDVYEQLEGDMLLRLLSHQLSLLNESLELEHDQLSDVQKILTVELSDKRQLLQSSRLSDADFRRRLDQVSDTTEKNIRLILSPEQRAMFDRQLNLNRNRLVG
jgi:hypothetical protein